MGHPPGCRRCVPTRSALHLGGSKAPLPSPSTRQERGRGAGAHTIMVGSDIMFAIGFGASTFCVGGGPRCRNPEGRGGEGDTTQNSYRPGEAGVDRKTERKIPPRLILGPPWVQNDPASDPPPLSLGGPKQSKRRLMLTDSTSATPALGIVSRSYLACLNA